MKRNALFTISNF